MVVRVRVEIKRGDRVVETAAVAKSGYETEVPELTFKGAESWSVT